MFLQVQFSIHNKEIAYDVAQKLVENNLAACVQIVGPIRSVYFWNDKIEEGEEYLCLAKTTNERYQELEILVKSLHPYDVPEIIATTITKGSADYLNWIKTTVQAGYK